MKYEFLNQYVPVLRAKRKNRKPGSLLHAGYTVELVPGALRGAQEEGKYYAQEVSESGRERLGLGGGYHRVNAPARQPSKSIVRRVKSAFRHGHNLEVMDASRQQWSLPDCLSSRATRQPSVILAEVEGNSLTNSYQFSTSSPLVPDGHLGSLSISTAYMKSKPRSLQISLPHRRWAGSEGGVEADSSQGVITLQSRLPDWNERFQIFELDFGGRVCRDSIKNFQVERDGSIVSCPECVGC